MARERKREKNSKCSIVLYSAYVKNSIKSSFLSSKKYNLMLILYENCIYETNTMYVMLNDPQEIDKHGITIDFPPSDIDIGHSARVLLLDMNIYY